MGGDFHRPIAMQTLPKTFYEHIAHLFYAVAMADRKIEREEKLRIINFVKTYWNNPLEDTTGESIIYDSLRELIYAKVKSSVAYISFETYYRKHRSYFDANIKATIMETCTEITDSLSPKRKSEIIILAKLALLFR